MALNYKSSLSRYRRYLQVVQSKPLFTTTLWVILSLILLIVLIVLALRPTLITIADLLSRIKQQNQVSQRLDSKMLEVQQALAALEDTRDKLYLLDIALPKEALWNELSSNLVGLATQSGTVLENIVVNKIPLSPDELTGTKPGTVIISMPKEIIPIKFTIIAKGQPENIRSLVELVERMRRVSIVNMVQINLNKEGDYRVTIMAETGYLPEKYLL
jgi:hypothetical protein